MAVEILVGVEVTDETMYMQYRHHMVPLLLQHGGLFMLDLKVTDVMKPLDAKSVNRMFAIRFPSDEIMARFFSDPHYLEVKQRFFEPGARGAVTLGHYLLPEKND